MGQLHLLDANNQRRAELAGLYFQRLELTDFILPSAALEQSNWHMFQVLLPQELAKQRPVLIRLLKEAGIGSGVHYPSIHTNSLYRQLGWRAGDLPHTESVAARILNLDRVIG
jgi:dTDP-4-amino-4,6-dideoxygalactose transaminase